MTAIQETPTRLFRKFQSGDSTAMSALARLVEPQLLRFGRFVLDLAWEDAEDVAQETFLAAVQQPLRWRGDCHFVAWLYAIARNKAADLGRRAAREPRPVGEAQADSSYEDGDLDPLACGGSAPRAWGDGPATAAHRAEVIARVREEVAALPPLAREAVRATKLADCTAADAAVLLDAPSGTVRRRVSDGIGCLRNRLSFLLDS